MITVAEVRIGNNIKQAHATLTVIGISKTQIQCDDFNGHVSWCNPENLDGIRLDEERLLKLGFKKMQHNTFRKEHLVISINGDLHGGTGHTNSAMMQGVVIAHTYYVHQLQNLCHDLTNQELTMVTVAQQ